MAELLDRYFDGDLNEQEAQAFLSAVAEDPDLVQPEIMLVSDGEDSVSITPDELNGIRLHVVLCHCGEQTELRKLSTSTRGIYTHLD